MFVRHLTATNFKPFSALDVELAGQPRLILACGINGTGKSSFIDAFGHWRQAAFLGIRDPDYFARGGLPKSLRGAVELQFHGDQPTDPRSAVYVRTAHRVSVEFSIADIGQAQDPVADPGPLRTIDLDTRVEGNYRRFINESVESLWSRAAPDRTARQIVEAMVGSVREPLARLLPGFVFEGPGANALSGGTFEFSKGTSQRYPYKVLSGGEKAVFDLLLDFVAKRPTFSDTVYCVDEPELHVNARIHGDLLDEMLGLLPDRCQLVLATHSAGILARARAIADSDAAAVAFLDFDGHDYDAAVELRPVVPDRAFWRRQLNVAFGSFAGLLAPARVVLCEGEVSSRDSPRASFDARCLEAIFGDQMPDTTFMVAGNNDEVANDRLRLAERITTLVDGVELIRVIDRDARSEQEIAEAQARGTRILRRRNLECYLLGDDVLTALCIQHGQPAAAAGIIAARADAMTRALADPDRNVAPDDWKAVRGEVVTAARRALSLTQGGSGADVFLRDTLAPLLRAGMQSFEELRGDVFGALPPTTS